jgi:hypothetical protein
MNKSIKVPPKKRRGRLATGKDPHVSARMPAALIAEVDSWASAHDTTRSDAFRRLVEIGLIRPEAIRRLIELGLKSKCK